MEAASGGGRDHGGDGAAGARRSRSQRSIDKPGMREVAEFAGVAMSSVSRVLSDHPDVSPEMRERVERAVEQLGYQPDMLAQSLRLRATFTVGFIVSDISNPLLATIALGAETTLREAGYSAPAQFLVGALALDLEALAHPQQVELDAQLQQVPRLARRSRGRRRAARRSRRAPRPSRCATRSSAGRPRSAAPPGAPPARRRSPRFRARPRSPRPCSRRRSSARRRWSRCGRSARSCPGPSGRSRVPAPWSAPRSSPALRRPFPSAPRPAVASHPPPRQAAARAAPARAPCRLPILSV